MEASEGEIEEVLASGGVTHVVKVGATVRRPVREFTATIQAFLAHLHAQGFRSAPVPLGYDDAGREVLSFVPGEVPVEPLPAYATRTSVLIDLARLIRRLHDAAEAWVPPSDAVFGSLPGHPPPGLEPLFDEPELVSHQDYCPGNVVFRQGGPVALIDFDLARPTTRVADVVNALHWWVPLVPAVDRPPTLVDADIAGRVRVFVDAYGLTPAERSQVVSVARPRAHNAALTLRAAADADPVFRRWRDEGANERVQGAKTWLAAEATTLDAALNAGGE